MRGEINDFTWRYLLDISAAYPTNGYAFNVSKETTKREPISIGNLPSGTIKEQVINFSAGHVNAVSFCNNMFNLPTLDQMADAFLTNEENTVSA